MELPFTIVFEAPSREELRAACRMRGTWAAGLAVALAIGTTFFLSSVGRASATAPGALVPLRITSRPPGATVRLDGRESGHTPLEVQVEPGAHTALLSRGDRLDVERPVQVGAGGATLSLSLWRRQPLLSRLRPALPGAQISDARLLADGGVVLVLALAPNDPFEAWRLDPGSGAFEPLLAHVANGRVAVTADAATVAYVGADIGPPPAGSGPAQQSVLWLVGSGRSAPSRGWRAPLEPGEHLVDVSWTPAGERVLAVSEQELGGGAVRSRAWLVQRNDLSAHEVLRLPSHVVAGSEAWSPDGQRVSFVAHAGALNALCRLDTGGEFAYLADLDPSPTTPLPYPRAAWSSDGQRLLFVAPYQHVPGVPFGWVEGDVRHALYVAGAADLTPTMLHDTHADLAAWREPGEIVGLQRRGDQQLGISVLRAEGDQQLMDLPLRSGADYAAIWDMQRGRLLVASRSSSRDMDYWFADFGGEDSA